MQKRAAEKAAPSSRATRRRALECRALALLVPDDPMRHRRWNALAGLLLSGMSDKPRDRYPHTGPSPALASVGKALCSACGVLGARATPHARVLVSWACEAVTPRRAILSQLPRGKTAASFGSLGAIELDLHVALRILDDGTLTAGCHDRTCCRCSIAPKPGCYANNGN